MKKWFALLLVLTCLSGLFGCHNKSLAYIIKHELSITGTVKQTSEDSILIENESGEYFVSLHTESKDSVTDFSIGDEVIVYYDGNIAESYPMQIHTVYAITLR